MIRTIIHILSITSAILNIGKLKTWIFIKSLTHHRKILSIKFHKVPASKNMKEIGFIFLFFSRKIKAIIANTLMNITMYKCIGNDQDIPVLNDEGMNGKFENRFGLQKKYLEIWSRARRNIQSNVALKFIKL